MEVKELYEYNDIGDKFLLTVYEDDSIKLVLCKKDDIVEKENPIIYDIGTNGGKRIEYGKPTSNVKSSLPFRNYSDGKLDKRWEKVK